MTPNMERCRAQPAVAARPRHPARPLRQLARKAPAFTALLLAAALTARAAPAPELDEFKVKREPVFEFAQKPVLTRDGDRVTIRFTSKGCCDATIAVEDADGRIIRHLASGVLGPNAPEPFQKNSLAQAVVWDGKNDQGKYVDDKDRVIVRVSLGLKPRFERALFWSPYKRTGLAGPILCAAPEGIYVCEGYAVDHVRLFDHNANYVRTIYPFPADTVDRIAGIRKHTFVQDGKTRPLKHGYHQATLLTCGTNTNPRSSGEGFAATGIAAHDGKVALVHLKLNRLAADGSSGGLPLEGPGTTYLMKLRQPIRGKTEDLPGPRSGAFSPDGKYLYLTGWAWNSGQGHVYDWIPGVVRLEFAKNAEPELFAGSLKQDDVGSDNAKFTVPSSVACDAKGRVYVADHINDRIQVFNPDGKLYKTIPVARPAHVEVHQKTGDIYVFSWLLVTRYKTTSRVEPVYTRLGPVDDPRVITRCPLPLLGHSPTFDWNISGGLPFRMTLDSWTDEPTIWLVPGAAHWIHSGNGSILEDWRNSGIRLLVEREGKLVVKRDFGAEVERTVLRPKPPILWRQRLYVNPKTGKLYVAEGDCGVMKAVNQLVELDPDSGKIGLLDLPMGSEDLCFDATGLAYLRTDTVVARYSPATWREIPWDYGEEFPAHSFGMGATTASLTSGLHTPGHRSNPFWHMGGMDVSLKGHLVVNSCNLVDLDIRTPADGDKASFKYVAKPYTPRLYPGRARWGEVHIWDEHGKLVCEDAVPGVAHMNGIGIDERDNLYMMMAARRLIDGKPVDPALERDVSCTLVKVPAQKAKVLSDTQRAPVPLGEALRPKRPVDFSSGWTGGAWFDGAQWFYGGVGFNPGGCICWNSRFDLDYFGRSFAPEPLLYSVAVLDSGGNLILRVGQYGNADDGQPLVTDSGRPRAKPIGGDEVGLFYACYVAAHTDRRLFVADAGNARILAVRLDYQTTEKVALRDVQDQSQPGK